MKRRLWVVEELDRKQYVPRWSYNSRAAAKYSANLWSEKRNSKTRVVVYVPERDGEGGET